MLLVLVIIVLAGIYIFTQQKEKEMVYSDQQVARDNTTELQKAADSNTAKTTNFAKDQDCTTPIKFTHQFTDIKAIDSIIPPVFRNSKGTMPTMLINIQGKVPLYMPTSGKFVQGSYHTEQGAEFYMWEIDVGCGITVVFDHVTEPIEKIRSLFPKTPRSDTRTDFFDRSLEMEAGELVGYTTGSVNAHNWNFAVYDASEKNYLWETGEFANVPKYFTQVCPFRYYESSIAQAYEERFILSFNDIIVEKNLCENKSS